MQLVGQGHAGKKYIIIQTHIIVSFPQPQHIPPPSFCHMGGRGRGGGWGGGGERQRRGSVYI